MEKRDQHRGNNHIKLNKEDLDIESLIQKVSGPEFGAISIFMGITRFFNPSENYDQKDQSLSDCTEICPDSEVNDIAAKDEFQPPSNISDIYFDKPRNEGEKVINHTLEVAEKSKHPKSLVKSLYYEAYTGMALKQIECVCNNVRELFQCVGNIAVEHKIGECLPGKSGLNVCVSSVHRDDSMQAVEYIVNEIKNKVAIWKKETYLEIDDYEYETLMKDTSLSTVNFNDVKDTKNPERNENFSIWRVNSQWRDQLSLLGDI